MDVDEKDEYEIISEMEKPANFLTQRDVENEEPETIGINMHTQGNVANLEVKRPSRWDVGAPFCIQLNDALTSNTNETVVKTCTTGLDEARNGAYNKTSNENGGEKICINDVAALEIASTKVGKCTKNVEISVATERGNNQISNLSLNKIALPCDPCDIALPPEPSELIDDASCELSSLTAEDKLASEATLDKAKVIIKWKFTKTPKELPSGGVKIWEPEVKARELPKLHPEEQLKPTLRCTETSLGARAFAESLDFDTSESSYHTESLVQQSADLGEIALPPCSPKSKPSVQSQSTNSLSKQDQSGYLEHEMQFLDNQFVKQKTVPQKASEEQSTFSKSPGSNCSNILESSSNLQYNRGLETNSVALVDDETETATEATVQGTVASWFAMHFPQELHLKEEKLQSESVFLQQQWRMDVSKVETNGEGEQESSLSSVSSATSVSMYSFNSTPKILSSSDLGILRTAEAREQIPETAGTVNEPTHLNDSTNGEPLLPETTLALNENEGESDVSTLQISTVLLKPASQPAQYEHLDENIILCDENLIKEAKVGRNSFSFSRRYFQYNSYT